MDRGGDQSYAQGVFRVLDVPPAGSATVATGPDALGPPPAGTLRWVDLWGQDEPQLLALQKAFDFHPLAIEDCAHLNQRPKLEEYRDHLFLVTQAFEAPEENPSALELVELHVFLGADYLVTVHERPIPAVDAIWRRVSAEPELARRGADFIVYLVCDTLVDSQFPIFDRLEEAIETLEEQVLSSPAAHDVERLYELRRALVTMRRVLAPQRDVFGLLARRGDPRVAERTALYFRDVYDHLVRLHEAIEAGRDLLANAFDAYRSMVSNRTNEIMKRLTILSAIFLPLTFITGFFGQNFEHLPFSSDALMYAMIAACLVIPTGMLVWFYRSRWL